MATPAEFARFVDRCHRAGLGVLLDWVPAHFPVDPHGLARFDGTALYEHADPRQGLHPDWTTAIFDFGRPEVVDYLIANALFWLDRYHVDGFRVDAVASMLHLDYSRKEGEWVPNRHGGNQNLEAVAFLRKFNEEVHARHPGVITIAEESTTWPGVSHPVRTGGLGFGFKWNMGWMHDMLAYLRDAPAIRRKRHDRVTFGITYAFAENFVLALSHDEVVHGKLSLLGKMNGDRWQQFATLRAFYAFMWSYPGKKLLFMGQEFAQEREWDFMDGLRVAFARHCRSTAACRRSCATATMATVRIPHCTTAIVSPRDSNGSSSTMRATRSLPGCAWTGAARLPSPSSPISRRRRTGATASDCRWPGRWREILNTDSALYGGSNVGNAGEVVAHATPRHGYPFSAKITVPPLSTVWLLHDGE